ncbi:ABC transporter permease [Mangrovicoccus algicola]|uniref:ABC transporter permease n=1 Tax=Mangrovicoccus algicola TaxID=2771008 RepID=A0A8J6Z5K5_9RHOB|nr:ABC transporter permease [Mangrovicoccus algicola]MBE3638124.1 ABC transporter permease [Mangrovicoccus algicola]
MTAFAPSDAPRRTRSFWWRVLMQPAGAIACAIIVLLLAAAGLADLLAPHDPTRMAAGRPLTPPSLAYPMGTDELGRDVLSRIMYGARLTLRIGAIAVGISLVLGLTVGLLAAYLRGWLEALLMRSVDVLFSFTETLIALAFVAVLGPSLTNAMIAVGVAGIPFYARTAYASALSERSKPWFEGAVAAGAGPGRLLFLHLLPNVMPTMIVVATLGLSNAILAAAALSFLGLGAQPPQPEWGFMLSAGRDFFSRAPWLMLFPGLAIALTVLAFNLAGDALREAMDPRSLLREDAR